jgi:predicted enzyme related to lactoylglutathione lyase
MNARFRGLYTAIYHVADLARAKVWYARSLGVAPYFDEPFYVGFNVGGHELGLVPAEAASAPAASRVVAYSGVDDIHGTLDLLLAEGAKPHEQVQDVGGGIKVATVLDSEGNIFGLIENPHFPTPAS